MISELRELIQMNVQVECECEICKKLVPVKSMKITKDGKLYLTLKCGHFSGFLFAGIIYLVKEPSPSP